MTERNLARLRFTHWKGQFVLLASWLFPPVLVLWNQELSYMTVPWACARGGAAHATIHVVPLLCLAAVIACGWSSYANWRRTGRGPDVDAATVEARSRFLAILGMIVSAYAALIIVTMWLPMFLFDPCVTS